MLSFLGPSFLPSFCRSSLPSFCSISNVATNKTDQSMISPNQQRLSTHQRYTKRSFHGESEITSDDPTNPTSSKRTALGLSLKRWQCNSSQQAAKVRFTGSGGLLETNRKLTKKGGCCANLNASQTLSTHLRSRRISESCLFERPPTCEIDTSKERRPCGNKRIRAARAVRYIYIYRLFGYI